MHYNMSLIMWHFDSVKIAPIPTPTFKFTKVKIQEIFIKI